MFTESLASCNIITFFIGISEICFMTAPVGDCLHCCPRNDAQDIQFRLFTRSNPTVFELIPQGDANALRRTSFNPVNPTVIYLMGFSETVAGPSTITLRDAHLSTGNYNFISVDWSRLIAFPWYITAVRNTRYMGVRMADFVQFLSSVGVPPASLHVIGFSLGAEAAGFGGKELRRRGMLLGRITGLDPAYPGYRLSNDDGHLSRGDASFVDVVHTNPGIFGFPQPIGDVDFYPNPGNWIQPGCWFDQLIRNGQFQFAYGCSHNRAWRYYAESLYNPTGFPATLCRDWKSRGNNCNFQVHGHMGVGARRPMIGKMFLETNEKPPFAKNGP
ncbi:pancreatic triacylglycerol lipase [Hyposmocoma kahamanoa]|uniref:pancreatic triacylglycerol lipase n=1 Tax=Hyposmocoma kahamanoa TaxID=1477025 RepID=UPI000E6D6EBE|nr:pancreatic triacylglycerol lipase [Hyposmocoma kahamanoa]